MASASPSHAPFYCQPSSLSLYFRNLCHLGFHQAWWSHAISLQIGFDLGLFLAHSFILFVTQCRNYLYGHGMHVYGIRTYFLVGWLLEVFHSKHCHCDNYVDLDATAAAAAILHLHSVNCSSNYSIHKENPVYNDIWLLLLLNHWIDVRYTCSMNIHMNLNCYQFVRLMCTCLSNNIKFVFKIFWEVHT